MKVALSDLVYSALIAKNAHRIKLYVYLGVYFKTISGLNSYCSDSKRLPMFWYHSCTKMSSDRSNIVYDFLVNFNSYEYREVQSRQKNCYNLLSNWRRLNLFTSITFSLNAIAKHHQGRFCQKHFRTSFTLRNIYSVWRLVLVMNLSLTRFRWHY